jgi:hypothetical protein
VDDFNFKLSKNNTKICNILTSKLSDLLKKTLACLFYETQTIF